MKSLLLILISGALINNVVLNQFLGICSFLGVSKQMKASASLGVAVIFVITIASAVASLLYTYVLKPFGLEFMKTIVFILVIAALVQIVEMFLKKSSPGVYKSLGIFLPLITTNCCILGVAILVAQGTYNAQGLEPNLLTGVIYAVSTALGFGLALTIFAAIREQLAMMDVPKGMAGMPIALVVAGLLAMAFMGFGGVDNGLAKVFGL